MCEVYSIFYFILLKKRAKISKEFLFYFSTSVMFILNGFYDYWNSISSFYVVSDLIVLIKLILN